MVDVVEKVVFDTNVVQALTAPYREGNKEIKLYIRGIYDSHRGDFYCYVSPITIAEITHQAWFSDLGWLRKRAIKRVLRRLGCLNITPEVGDHFAGLKWRQGTKGSPQENDQWQTALIVHYKTSLLTLDKNLSLQASHIKSAKIINPLLDSSAQ